MSGHSIMYRLSESAAINSLYHAALFFGVKPAQFMEWMRVGELPQECAEKLAQINVSLAWVNTGQGDKHDLSVEYVVQNYCDWPTASDKPCPFSGILLEMLRQCLHCTRNCAMAGFEGVDDALRS